MYIGTTKTIHIKAKSGNGIPANMLTADNNIVVNGAVFVVGSRIKKIVNFGDGINIYSITPSPYNPYRYEYNPRNPEEIPRLKIP